MNTLYHADIFLPASIESACHFGAIELDYSYHAKQAAKNDRYGRVELSPYLNTNKADVIEVEMEGNRIVKIVYRVPLDLVYDVCLAIIPHRRFVKTVWVNRRDDKHTSLDRSRYAVK